MAENDNDQWEKMLPWLFALRRRRISVVIVHHAGRNGQMRGASRREDAAHWILSLRDDPSANEKEKAIVATFTKCRNCSPADAAPTRWTLSLGTSRLTYTCKRHSGPDALFALVAAGVVTCKDLAEELAVSTGTISKWAAKAGMKTNQRREYELPEAKA